MHHLWPTDFTGILQSAAFWVSNRGGTSGRKLFFYFYLLTTGLSSILGNDPVILSGTHFLVYFTRVAEVSPIAWLFSEFTTCNTASMLLFVGNFQNFRSRYDNDNLQVIPRMLSSAKDSMSIISHLPRTRSFRSWHALWPGLLGFGCNFGKVTFQRRFLLNIWTQGACLLIPLEQ